LVTRNHWDATETGGPARENLGSFALLGSHHLVNPNCGDCVRLRFAQTRVRASRSRLRFRIGLVPTSPALPRSVPQASLLLS